MKGVSVGLRQPALCDAVWPWASCLASLIFSFLPGWYSEESRRKTQMFASGSVLNWYHPGSGYWLRDEDTVKISNACCLTPKRSLKYYRSSLERYV